MPLPLRPRPIDLPWTPVEAAARLRARPGLVFFDSALAPRGQEISLLASDPDLILRGETEADWQALERELARRSTEAAGDFGFPCGFAAGWVEYEGAFTFGFYRDLLVYSHATGQWSEVGHLARHLSEPVAPSSAAEPAPIFQPEMAPAHYHQIVRRAQAYIASGDIYQVNLAHRFTAAWAGDPFTFYQALREQSPAPQAAFLDLAGRQVLSASPESFLWLSGRHIRTRPIKGTRPRRADPKADERSGYDLLTSPKEIAELVMITDLMRHDLGRLAEWGSVRVSELLVMERFAQVFHLVSTIEAALRPEISHPAALRACFPGGSITGAPKIRAMQIIRELEATPRGLYTGALGYFGFNGESAFNLAIRTVIAEADGAGSATGKRRPQHLHFHVGAGIVADSIPAAEYQETLDKAAGPLEAARHLPPAPRSPHSALIA